MERGYIIWQGASQLDGKPIVAIATTKTSNRKTGDMIQTWIIRSDVNPIHALETNADRSICGDCPHRRSADTRGDCYVNVGQAPLAVYNAFHRGSYSTDTGELVRHIEDKQMAFRIGSYGDPAAVPLWVWERYASRARRWAGYTHQWRTCDQYLRHYVMASVDSEAEYWQAKAAGWRTFRVTVDADERLDFRRSGEVLCPASEEAGQLTQCERCGLCAGIGVDGERGNVRDVMIPVHGRIGKARAAKLTINGR